MKANTQTCVLAANDGIRSNATDQAQTPSDRSQSEAAFGVTFQRGIFQVFPARTTLRSPQCTPKKIATS